MHGIKGTTQMTVDLKKGGKDNEIKGTKAQRDLSNSNLRKTTN